MNIELPASWELVKFKDISEINPSLNVVLGDNDEVSFIPMKNVEELSGKMDTSIIKKYCEVKKGYTKFVDGDILLAKITPCMENGKFSIANHLKNGVGFGSTEFHVIRLYSELVREYFFYYFIQENIRNYAAGKMTGTAGQKRVPAKILEELEVPLPPLGEQRRIVSHIEQLFTQIDDGVRYLQQAQEDIEHYQYKILQSAFSGQLLPFNRSTSSRDIIKKQSINKIRRNVPEKVEMPEDIQKIKLPQFWIKKSVAILLREGFLLDVKDGNHGTNHPKTSDFSAQGLPFIVASDVENFQINYSSAYKIQGLPLKKLKVGFTQIGDVVLTHKGTVGKVAISNMDAVLSPQTTYYRINPDYVYGKYLMYFMSSPIFQNQLRNMKSQTTRDFVPITKQYQLFIFLPQIEEQEIIASIVESIFKNTEEIKKNIIRSLKIVDVLKHNILLYAFQGKLTQQDSIDEPASALLEKIKAAHSSQKELRDRRRLF